LLPSPSRENGNGNGNGSVQELHHDPRVEIVEEHAPVAAEARAALPQRSRALRITTVKSNGRRRWAVDFLVREHDAEKNGK
jgi:hypothetical protein